MNENGIALLCSAIVEQAVLDYRDLRRLGVEEHKKGSDGEYSISELESFFRSKYCKLLLQGADSKIDDGVLILRKLKSEQVQ